MAVPISLLILSLFQYLWFPGLHPLVGWDAKKLVTNCPPHSPPENQNIGIQVLCTWQEKRETRAKISDNSVFASNPKKVGHKLSPPLPLQENQNIQVLCTWQENRETRTELSDGGVLASNPKKNSWPQIAICASLTQENQTIEVKKLRKRGDRKTRTSMHKLRYMMIVSLFLSCVHCPEFH